MDSGLKSKLERWMRAQILVLDEDRGRCIRFALRHVAAGRQGAEVLSLKVPKKDFGEQWISDIVNELEGRITDDTEGLGSGVQTYVLLPFFEAHPDKPIGRFTIREAPMSMEDETDSEPPTKTGMLAQNMRHTEAAIRMSLGSMGQIMTTLKNANARQADLIEKLMAEKMENLSVMERLRSEETIRSLALRREDASEKMKIDLFEKAMTLLPIVVNRIAGKNLLPSKQSSVEAVTKSLVESITQEQVNALQGIFQPHQLVALMEIFQTFQESDKRDPALPPRSGNGSAHPQ